MDIKITVNLLQHGNRSKNRPQNVLLHKDKQAKFFRNSGLPYFQRNGNEGQEKMPPHGGKVCNRCNKEACSWDEDKKRNIFLKFWSSDEDNHNKQSAILASCIRWTVPAQRTVDLEAYTRRKFTYQYALPDENGIYHEVCLPTLLNVFQISQKRVFNVQKKLAAGEIKLNDGRGLHLNRPHRHTEDLKSLMLEQIHKYPKIISHYCRANGDPLREYLECDLSVSQMFRDFVAEAGEEYEDLEHLYRRMFKTTGLRIGAPKCDTCDNCDEMSTNLYNTDPSDVDRIEQIENRQRQHHIQAESGYENLRLDIQRGKDDNTYFVMCIDLMKSLLWPKLTCGKYYYFRKPFTYNFAITLPSSNTSTMCIWNENEGRRGYIEIASCILKFIQNNFRRLEAGQHRSLTVWSDRCSGQNNNYGIVCVLKYIMHLGYFTEIDQKFLVSGHSFLPCDRQFAVIERKLKTSTIFEPEDIVNVIREASPQNPFIIQRMNRNDFKSFAILREIIPKPNSLKVSQIYCLRMSIDSPSNFLTKQDHLNATEWTEHRIISPYNVGVPVNQRCVWESLWIDELLYNGENTFVEEYSTVIPISIEKIRDLKLMLPYIPANRQPYLLQFIADNDVPP